MDLKSISEILLGAKKIGITYHVSPDGDAVGSVLALLQGLKSLNKNCYVISKDSLSDNLKFLKGCLMGACPPRNMPGRCSALSLGTDWVDTINTWLHNWGCPMFSTKLLLP